MTMDDRSITMTDAAGTTRTLAKSDLSGVIVETNDTGPWGTDFWWLLFGADDALAAACPKGATGETELVAYLTALPGFDYDEFFKAIGSTDNAVFPVWRRPLAEAS